MNMTDYVDALEQSLRASLMLAEEFTDADWHRPSRCPGWDVHDQIAHLIGVEAQLAGDPVPPAAPEAPHVTSTAGAHLERSVHARRGVPGPDLLAEFHQVIARRMVQLRARPVAPDEQWPGVVDGRPFRADRMLPLRVFDVWAHEQDIRAAVDRPGNMTSIAADASWRTISDALPRLLAKIDGPPGLVAFDLTGVRATQLTARAGTRPPRHGTRQPDVLLRMDFGDFIARVCGREGSPPVEVVGDGTLGTRVLAALRFTR